MEKLVLNDLLNYKFAENINNLANNSEGKKNVQ